MEILRLKYFCHAAKTENFSHTAKHFSVPPSNISQCIRRLETELGCKLFERGKNSLTLSESGRKYYEKISVTLKLIDEAQREIANRQKQDELTICALTNRRIVMRAAEELSKKGGNIKISISHTYNPNEDYDVIISDECDSFDKKTKKLILTENIVLAINKSNPLAAKTTINSDDLKKESFVCLHNESNLYKTTMLICNRLNLEPNIVIQSPDPYYVRKCVELNLGVSLFPEISWQGQFSDNVKIISIGDFQRNTYAYINSDIYNKNVESFVKMVDCNSSSKNRSINLTVQ